MDQLNERSRRAVANLTMEYVSTRGSEPVSLDVALAKGIADDGGLYFPTTLPNFVASDFDLAETLSDVAGILLAPFFEGSRLSAALDDILAETLSFPIPTTLVPGTNASLLELYHGPTAAFKDVGARFLSACLSRLDTDQSSPLTILVATSGDTGGAVAAAFDDRPGKRVVVLFPDGRVSDRQAHQLTCWSNNVLSLRVQGSFDDCQALVKAAFVDEDLSARFRFSSANSINIGRLLPQTTYYADTSLSHYRKNRQKPGFVIPTGNLGNALACVMAREMGLPIGPIVIATNANRTIPDYFESLQWSPRQGIQTLASAMDVGDPSNMERLQGFLGNAEELRDKLQVVSVSDEEIRKEIMVAYESSGIAMCPHTATASHTWRHMGTATRASTHWILVATAHAAKFETIVEPLIKLQLPLPTELAALLSRPCSSHTINPNLDELASAMDVAFPHSGTRDV